MVFCAYCGKSFTRKEHLERHIPQHTNVKPHRCSACQLSFARRDLLQRHHSTYHEARDPMEPLPGGVPTVAGRTPIACQNCANAKTGCDKRVPCSRCAEKNLPCAARFARRSSKAAARAAQASAALSNQLVAGIPRTQSSSISPPMMNIDHGMPQATSLVTSPPKVEPVAAMDPELHSSPQAKSTPDPNSFGSAGFPSPHSKIDMMGDFMHISNDFVGPEPSYSEMLVWPDYSLDLETDLYSNALALRPDLTMPTFSDFSDISSGSDTMTATPSVGSIHTRGTSITSTTDFELKPNGMTMCSPNGTMIPEFEVVIAAECSWPLARCNKPRFSSNCPRTAIVHLEAFEQKCKQDGTWDSLNEYLGKCDSVESPKPTVIPISSRTRDKMTAITQSFLHKALDVHRSGSNSYGQTSYSSPGNMFNFIMLPPNHVLEYFLGSYVRSLADYYPLAPSMKVDPNEMLQNNQASTLLVLLMIAQGAATVPIEEARYLSAGLTETSRISLFDIIEKDVELSADPTALRCALLFTLLGAWSGDKWQMDIAMGQRGMYLSMIKHAGMLEQQSSMIPAFNDSTTTELQWRAWLQRESQNRLVYNWAMLDLELSLFHDTAPLLAVSELQCPLPGPDLLWRASNSQQWASGIQSIYGSMTNINPHILTTQSLTPSLFGLFQDFLQDNLSHRQACLGPQQMRLLLHPLQSLLCHLRQILSCFTDILGIRRPTGRTVSKASTNQRLEEVQGLLQRWYELAVTMHTENPSCSATKCNLVLYHLISLNAVTSFPEIERLARKEGFEAGGPTYWELGLRHKRCIYQREEAVFHCGQVLKLLRSLPVDRQPSWCSAAIYRVTLILWTDGIGRLDPSFKTSASPVAPQEVSSPANSSIGPRGNFAIDQVTPEDPSVIAYLWGGDGTPLLTKADGLLVSLDNPLDVLDMGIKTIDAGVSTRIGGGIRRKLATLAGNWPLDSIGVGPTVVS
ncbi:hypothetical protein N0V93_000734 [Gnomoniopsis smithogilvyi]|uniref:Uncharacterized protein n=1 Tax=Gnomoniopsis smithogilvyi TaxID=1191159 RepID=A0A9W9D201_9PEZI|nr:hypothetical protein N0V93_000734 [Gnomoniopsis smithogilvyi]